jgi:hypothetical protein
VCALSGRSHRGGKLQGWLSSATALGGGIGIAPESRRLEVGAKWNVFQKHFPFAPWSRPTEAEPAIRAQELSQMAQLDDGTATNFACG